MFFLLIPDVEFYFSAISAELIHKGKTGTDFGLIFVFLIYVK